MERKIDKSIYFWCPNFAMYCLSNRMNNVQPRRRISHGLTCEHCFLERGCGAHKVTCHDYHSSYHYLATCTHMREWCQPTYISCTLFVVNLYEVDKCTKFAAYWCTICWHVHFICLMYYLCIMTQVIPHGIRCLPTCLASTTLMIHPIMCIWVHISAHHSTFIPVIHFIHFYFAHSC